MGNAVMPQAATVLVVDDDVFSQAIFRKRLVELGVDNIHEADNGKEAMLRLDAMARAPDFLICDIFMPDMDGIEFIGELAKRSYPGGLILVTGGNQNMLEVAADIASMSGLRLLASLYKPVALHALRQAMGVAAD